MTRAITIVVSAFMLFTFLNAQRPRGAMTSEGTNQEKRRPSGRAEIKAKDPDDIQWTHEFRGNIPGVSYRTFHSPSMKVDVGYAIYLPAAYETGTNRYPVIYWLHGIGGNEVQSSRNSSYLHQLIASGKAEPTILVFVNGAAWSMYLDSVDGNIMVETGIIHELLPHVDKTFRTIAGKSGRSIEGFSMGGFGSLRLAFKHPDLFVSVVVYGPAVLRPGEVARSHQDIFKIMLNGDTAKLAEEEPVGLLLKNLDAIKKSLKIRMVLGTEDIVYAGAKSFHELLETHGVPHEYEELPGVKHLVPPYYEKSGEAGYRFHERARKGSNQSP